MTVKALGVIPARYASSRFPGKPLVMIDGKSMIQRVYEQSVQCRSLSRILVATDDSRILEHVKSFGGECLLTSEHHSSGTERIGEVIGMLEEAGPTDFSVIVNIQGDEPKLDPQQIALAVECFNDPAVQISTLMKQIGSQEELFNPNVVKVITDHRSEAIYFSRSTIPYLRDCEPSTWVEKQVFFKHIGLYAYRIEILKQILKLPVSSLEKAESLEQLRWLENGFRIKVVPTLFETISVDTPEDLLKLTNKI
jgi:3-deoxy-manno-octulosonate cytidylyltransferase (CMP-KDO synthetase)